MTDVRREFPHEFAVVEHVPLAMADGTHLSAKLWLPDTPDPVPAILEYLPYRKDDVTLWRDQAQLGWLAGHGYACVRVDLRGTGDSEGIIRGEYLPQELADGADVIAWIARQPWCDGAVGMWGISWGGFNALQIAALRPPALKAVISVAGTVDRYADDVHYRGGCVLGSDMLSWATEMLARNALPPTPRLVGDTWMERWLERLDATPPFLHDWLAHQTRDGFWQHGSVGDDFGAIDVPALVVAGLADGYRNAPFLAVQGMPARAWGIVGPWSHNYPEFGDPGPNIGFLQLAKRWWDRWLRGEDAADLPRLAAYVQEAMTPSPDHARDRPGRWIADPVATDDVWWLGASGLAREAEGGVIEVSTAQQHGLHGGSWWSAGEPGTGPSDQRPDDDLAHVLDGPVAEAEVTICGFPTLELRVAADRPMAMVAARLCDVGPDGRSLLVSRGQLNLTHRDSDEHPVAVEAGAWYDVALRLDAAAHRLAPGHRWRLALAATHWPLAWPAPEPATVSIDSAHSRLIAPVVEAPEDLGMMFTDPPEIGPTDRRELAPDRSEVTFSHRDGLIVRRHESGGGEHEVDRHGTTIATRSVDELSIADADPLSAVALASRAIALAWPGRRVRVEADASMTSDETAFHVSSRLRAWHGQVEVFDRSWTESFPRSLL